MNQLLQGINPVLHNMVANGKLNRVKLDGLRQLKTIVDSFAITPYLSHTEEEQLVEKYGERPNILSWGDYFQTEIASRYFDFSDLDFRKIIETVRFDLISATLIFKGKPVEFLEKVKQDGLYVNSLAPDSWSENNKEAAHLFILYNYFCEMGLAEKNISQEDQEWLANFSENSHLNYQAG